jgi:hypothetical protein
MFNNSTPLTMPVAPISYGNNGGFGGFGDDWLALIVILALFGGYGNGGFGFGGGLGGGRSCGCEPCATKADLTAQGIVQKLDGITYGITDSTYALNNSIMSGFHGVDNAICTLGYQNQQGFNSLAHQISDCCCQTQGAVKDIRYDLATQSCDTRQAIATSTRDIIENQNANTRSIFDFLVQNKMEEKDNKISELQTELMLSRQNSYFSANQEAQTAELIRRLDPNPCPTAAYIVQPPQPVTFPTNGCGQFSGYGNYGYNNGCGCGCA